MNAGFFSHSPIAAQNEHNSSLSKHLSIVSADNWCVGFLLRTKFSMYMMVSLMTSKVALAISPSTTCSCPYSAVILCSLAFSPIALDTSVLIFSSSSPPEHVPQATGQFKCI